MFENSRASAYILWQITGFDNMPQVWALTEDIAAFLENSGYTDVSRVSRVSGLDRNSPEYVFFVRNLAHRLSAYTNCGDSLKNWYDAEALLADSEWLRCSTALALAYREACEASLLDIKNDRIRSAMIERT